MRPTNTPSVCFIAMLALTSRRIKGYYFIGYYKKYSLFRNCRGFVSIAGPRPSLHRIRRLGLGPTIEHTTAIPEDPKYSLFMTKHIGWAGNMLIAY